MPHGVWWLGAGVDVRGHLVGAENPSITSPAPWTNALDASSEGSGREVIRHKAIVECNGSHEQWP